MTPHIKIQRRTKRVRWNADLGTGTTGRQLIFQIHTVVRVACCAMENTECRKPDVAPWDPDPFLFSDSLRMVGPFARAT